MSSLSIPRQPIPLSDTHIAFITKMLRIAGYIIQPTIEGSPHSEFKHDMTVIYIHPDALAGFKFFASIPFGYISLERMPEFVSIDPTKWVKKNIEHLQLMGDPYATFIMKGLYLGSVRHIEPNYLSYLRVKFIVSIIETINLPEILNTFLEPTSSSLKDEHASAEPPFTVFHIDVKDNGASDQTEILRRLLDETVDKLHQNIEMGNTCLVHCQYGISRSSTIIAAYLIKYKQFTLSGAIEYMSSLRPQVAPKMNFRMLLKEYAQTLTVPKSELKSL